MSPKLGIKLNQITSKFTSNSEIWLYINFIIKNARRITSTTMKTKSQNIVIISSTLQLCVNSSFHLVSFSSIINNFLYIIYCTGMLMIDCLTFCLFENVFVSTLFLKDIFSGYRIPDRHGCFFLLNVNFLLKHIVSLTSGLFYFWGEGSNISCLWSLTLVSLSLISFIIFYLLIFRNFIMMGLLCVFFWGRGVGRLLCMLSIELL